MVAFWLELYNFARYVRRIVGLFTAWLIQREA